MPPPFRVSKKWLNATFLSFTDTADSGGYSLKRSLIRFIPLQGC